MSDYPSDTAERFQVRLPDGLRDEIKAAAAANNRSMNAEIVARLQGNGKSLRDDIAIAALAGMMAQSHAGPKDWTHMGHGWGEDCANDLNKHSMAVAATLAGFSYKLADAMLAERERSQP